MPPGVFNKACSLLFAGEYYGMLDNCWQGEDKVVSIVGMTLAQARGIFERETGMKTDEVELVRGETKIVTDMEIISTENERETAADGANPTNVTNATQTTSASKATNATELPSDGTLCRIKLREYNKPEAPEVTVRLENEIAEHAAVGMRVIGDFYKLDNGWWYWDHITNVYPSYYVPCDSDSSDYEEAVFVSMSFFY